MAKLSSDINHAMKRTQTIILAGGRGTRLKHLTDNRAKPAVHIGGKYRIIDFTLSNCINSGLRRISVLTQYKSHSLMRHLQQGWNLLRGEAEEFIEVLPAQQRIDESQWYQGTADAVYQNMDIFQSRRAEYVIILAGDHVYKMDYSLLLADHIKSGADITIPCIEVPISEASHFGIMHVDAEHNITDFVEKPANPPSIPGDPLKSLASMGIYVFNADFLFKELLRDSQDINSQHDFGKNLIPYFVAQKGLKIKAHNFAQSCVLSSPDSSPYWRDVGTVDAYWECNLDLTHVTPLLDLYDPNWPILTFQAQLPPAKFVFNDDGRRGCAVDSLVANGCIVSGSSVRNSVISTRTRINSYCTIDHSIILPEVEIGRGCQLTKVIVNRGCKLPEGLIVGEDRAEDERRFYVSENGVVLITMNMINALSS